MSFAQFKMPTATPKRSRATLVNQDAVKHVSTFLQELPEKPKEDLSLREAVGQMQDSLQAALAKGYSYQDLADMLRQQGIAISALTLKNYIPSGKRQTTGGKPKRARKLASEPSAVVEQTTPEPSEPVAEESPEATSAPSRKGRAKSTAAKPTLTDETGAAPSSKTRKQPKMAAQETSKTKANGASGRSRQSKTSKAPTQSASKRGRK